jgi:DNA processing protein
MRKVVKLELGYPGYPTKLLELVNPPRVLTTSGPLVARRAVAIVGSRRATEGSLAFAHDLAFQLARAGVVVVSGGAVGVDSAAHRGALEAGGATWVVSPTRESEVYPPQHRALFADIASSSESRMIWPFADDHARTPKSFLYRNGVLAALSEAVVVVQAHFKSGSRNAVSCALDLGRPVWAVTAFPWAKEFQGSTSEIEHGRARPLCSARQLLTALEVEGPPEPPQLALPYEPRPATQKNRRASRSARFPTPPPWALDTASWTSDEKLVFSKLWTGPMHMDQIVEATGLPVPAAATALLTLALKDVVVESPDGFFRRRTAP